ncbi:zinc carboxypeptidase [Nitzschia inconspicua]|uniref:Zinc carboxypeptidase n=1 Tax=Nitzschia inconspicua TaxID=303405 RepID=A0A9K3KHF5_9STRA|nr:zinc carboxypeptidase [Nitzschia inconspicua]
MSPIAPPPATDAPIQRYYPIGTPGTPWTTKEDEEWKASVQWHRSYQEEVVQKIEALKEIDVFQQNFVVEEYGCIHISDTKKEYPLYAIRSSGEWTETEADTKWNMVVTGGVHGYETSGVQGALLFVKQLVESSEYQTKYLSKFRICVAPCVTPWAYEHVQRWNADLFDPNRSFKDDASVQTKESAALMSYLKILTSNWYVQIDLHETTNTDLTEFMPAKHAKAGLPYNGEVIPDGFYLVGDDESSGRKKSEQLAFCQAIIESVKKVTHIAEPDSNGNIIDELAVSEGIILVPVEQLGLCCSATKAPYTATTEVYPDSPRGISADACNQAQVAAITGAMDHILSLT